MGSLISFLPKLRGLPAEEWAPRHRWIVALVWAHVPVLFAWGLIGPGYPLWHAAGDVAAIVALATLANRRRLSQTWRSCTAALGLVTCSAMVVHVAGGALAAHFHFFVALTVIGLYGQWKPFLLSIAYIVVHHLGVALIAPTAVFPNDAGFATTLGRTLVHAGFVVAEVIALVVNWKLAEDQQAQLDLRNRELDARTGELAHTVTELAESGEQRRVALDSVNAMSDEVLQSARRVAGSADEIRATIIRSGTATAQHSEAMESAGQAVEGVRLAAERTALDARDVAGAAEAAVVLTEAGAQALAAILNDLERIRTEVGATTRGVATLSDSVRQIGDITKAVDELSEQSKMLALNASIEAARAGEHGRGFAVVAHAVRGLAERSRESTSAVEQILREIDAATREAVIASGRGVTVVAEGARRAAETEDVMAQLSAAARSSAMRAGEIAAAASEQCRLIEDIAGAIGTAIVVTDELVGTNAHAEEVAGRMHGLAGDLEALTRRDS